MAYMIGQGGTVLVGTGSSVGTICVDDWQVDFANDGQDVTTVCSEGFQDMIAGITSAQATFTGFFDDSAPILTPVQPGYTLHFQFNIGSSGSFIEFDALVVNVNIDNPAKAPVKFTVTAKSTGAISFTA